MQNFCSVGALCADVRAPCVATRDVISGRPTIISLMIAPASLATQRLLLALVQIQRATVISSR